MQADGYGTLRTHDGRQALAVAMERKPDLILLDVMMPVMDGFETAAQLKASPLTQHIPVIMVTSLDDRVSKLRALEAGAEEFLTKPIDRADLRVRERTAQLDGAYLDTVFTLVRAAEHKDEETGHHVRRISHYCRVLADGMGLGADVSDAIFHVSPMHDSGKIGIPDHILLKPGGFTPEEWSIMQTHCAPGASILASGTSPYIRMGAQIAMHHHERWDGTGYPHGLAGEAIPLAARLMQICDVYDALRSKRPYKPAYDHARARTIITEGDGRTQPSHFDPAMLACFAAHADRFAEIYAEHQDD